MGLSYAERVRMDVQTRTQQDTLVRQIRRKFKDISPEMEQTIRSTQDLQKLEEWLDQFATADNPEDIGISPAQ